MSFSQDFTWEETFDAQPNGATEDGLPTAWRTDPPSSYVLFGKMAFPGHGVFAVNNTSEEGTWWSDKIDISAYPEIAISVTLGSYWASNTDYIRCYYKIDGEEEVLFGEQFGRDNLNIASVASAIVSGNTLQVIFKAYENTPGGFYGFPTLMGVDDITISSITYLFARQSGNWNNTTNTWSKISYDGDPCGCVPDHNSHVFIKDDNIALNANATTAGLTIEGSGNLNYTANAQLNIVKGGILEIASSAAIHKNVGVSASLYFPTYSYNVVVDGELAVDNIIINAANVDFSGSGEINVANNFTINNANGNVIVNAQENLTLNGSLNFASSSANVTFENKGKLTVGNRILFDNDGIMLKNTGTLDIGTNGIVVNNADDDGNQLDNSGVLKVGTINLNNGDFILNNSGSIHQTGNFANITTGSAFHNLSGGTWNFSGVGANAQLFTQYPNNTFHYSRAGDQDVYAPKDGGYHHMVLSGSGTKTTLGELTINGDLSLTGSAQLNAPAHITFGGNHEQMISSSSGTVAFSTLAVDKTTGNVQLSPTTDIAIANSLALANGGVDLNGGSLTILSSSPAAISRTSGFIKSETSAKPYSQVIWSVGTAIGEYVFPFGKTSVPEDYIPFTFEVTSAGVGAGTVSVATYATGKDNLPFPDGVTAFNNASGDDNSGNVVDRFWQIDLADYTKGPTADITFAATEGEVDGISNLRAQHWNTDEMHWDAPIAGQINGANSVTVPGVSSFSPWAIAGENSLLPIQLIYFKGEVVGDAVALEWKTAQEVNNDYFTIEKTSDLRTFYKVNTVNGKGTVYEESSYQAFDLNPFPGKSYYRLKQTDFNGDFQYAKIIPITFEAPFGEVALFPNPFDGKTLNLTFTGKFGERELPFEVFNSNGELVYSTVVNTVFGAPKEYKINFDKTLLPGLYLIKIGGHFKEKFVVEGDK